MAAPISLYTDSLNYINAVCESYVGENVAAVARVIGPFAFTMLTLYVALWGFAQYRGLIKEPANEFINRVITVCVVFGIGFNLANYNILITNTFLRGPDEFVAGLARSGGPNGVVNGLDAMLAHGFDLGARFWAKAGVLDGDMGMYFVALFVWFVTIVVTAYAFFLMALSKVALTVIIGLGSLFFLGLLFQATAGFFNSWIRQLANYFLIPLLVVMVNLLIMKLFANAGSGAASMTSTTEVAQVFPFFAMGLVSLLALASVLTMAAGLAGGVSLSSFGMGRLTAGLLRSGGVKLGKSGARLGAQASKPLGRTGKKIARSAWNSYQGRKRNTIQPAKTKAPAPSLNYEPSRPAKSEPETLYLTYEP
jgi:type IV secretion system protein VirB6